MIVADFGLLGHMEVDILEFRPEVLLVLVSRFCFGLLYGDQQL